MRRDMQSAALLAVWAATSFFRADRLGLRTTRTAQPFGVGPADAGRRASVAVGSVMIAGFASASTT